MRADVSLRFYFLLISSAYLSKFNRFAVDLDNLVVFVLSISILLLLFCGHRVFLKQLFINGPLNLSASRVNLTVETGVVEFQHLCSLLRWVLLRLSIDRRPKIRNHCDSAPPGPFVIPSILGDSRARDCEINSWSFWAKAGALPPSVTTNVEAYSIAKRRKLIFKLASRISWYNFW